MEVEQSENNNPPRETNDDNSSTTDLKEMWHPHVYRPPPKSPTPFSIDDILHSQNPSPRPMMTPSAMAATAAAMSNLANFTTEEWLRVAYYINNAMQQGQKMIHHSNNLTAASSSEESGRDSTESTNITTGDEDETQQPLNLSLTTTNNKGHPSFGTGDPYEHDFLLDSKSGMPYLLLFLTV